MSAQLEHHPPTVAAPRGRSPRDPDRGLGLLMSFVVAATIMVADVIVIAAVEQSWILIPGFVVLLITTAIVFVGIVRLLADGGEDAAHHAH